MKSKPWLIAFSVLFVLLLVSLVIYLLLNEFIRVYRIKLALYRMLEDDTPCKTNPQRCMHMKKLQSLEYPPKSSDFSKKIAFYCAHSIYHIKDHKSDGTILESEEIKLKNHPFIGYYKLDDKERVLYLFFRGTATKFEWDLDFEYQQIPLPKEIVDQKDSSIMIHEGFSQLFIKLVPQIRFIIEEQKDRFDNIVVSGHSLGGALSSICCVYLNNITSKPIFCYTFGKPRVGNSGYAKYVNKIMKNKFWRIENENDLIVQLPFAVIPNYKDYNQSLIFQHEGESIMFSENWESLRLNHSLKVYMQYLSTM